MQTAKFNESICQGLECQELPECSNRLTTNDFEYGQCVDSVSFEPMLLSDNTPKITQFPYEHFVKWYHNSEGYNAMYSVLMNRILSTDSQFYEYIKFVSFMV